MLLEVLKISLNIRSKTALGGFAKIVNYKAFVHVENVLLRNVYDWIYSRIYTALLMHTRHMSDSLTGCTQAYLQCIVCNI